VFQDIQEHEKKTGQFARQIRSGSLGIENLTIGIFGLTMRKPLYIQEFEKTCPLLGALLAEKPNNAMCL
jgi:hypothetical protein